MLETAPSSISAMTRESLYFRLSLIWLAALCVTLVFVLTR